MKTLQEKGELVRADGTPHYSGSSARVGISAAPGAHGAAAAPGPEVGTQEDAWLDWHHFHAALSSMDVMLCNVTAGDNDTRYHT
ncbi:hypothetical protein NQZ68_006139 [Dissostichus eleginoides]|nr:hypothetical protein NQZ68_006139 [Dissostichus eleginoides]